MAKGTRDEKGGIFGKGEGISLSSPLPKFPFYPPFSVLWPLWILYIINGMEWARARAAN
jgi:hypothetical protein